jgi:hypothetical protein
MPQRRRLAIARLPVLLLLVVACGGSSEPHGDSAVGVAVEEGSGGDGVTAESGASSGEGSSGEPGAAFAFTAADLDAYIRGIAKERELVVAAEARAARATTPAERAAAAQAGWEDQTAAEAARQLGVDAGRYRQTRDAVHEVLQTLDFQAKIDGPLEIDLTQVDAATRERYERDPFADLPPASAELLRGRLAEVVPAWSAYMTLTAVNG